VANGGTTAPTVRPVRDVAGSPAGEDQVNAPAVGSFVAVRRMCLLYARRNTTGANPTTP